VGEAFLAGFCDEEPCTECRGILLRTYTELRASGCGDEHAFDAAVRVLALRHPGHDHGYYAGRAAEWIETGGSF